MLADASGNPVNVFHYDAFGRILGRLDWSILGTSGSNWVSATSLNTVQPTQFLYAGEYWDEDLQLAYHRARYYSPNLGRFWTMDSDEGNQMRPRSLHKFLYAEADPINLRDPSGHSSLSDVAASIVGRATLAARSTGPFATGIRAAIGILTLASAAHDPEAFVASFESPNAAASVLALDAGFVLYYTKRAVNFTTGFVAARLEIQPAIEAVLAQSAQRVRQLDADALIGFRGSTARGYKGPHKNNDPFDPDHFDVDGFVVSDKLAAKIPKIRGARFADASSSPELAAEQQRIDGELRSKLKGLKDSDFTFRVFTYQEYYRKFKDGKLIED
jgi:RHS repeat-associated protein